MKNVGLALLLLLLGCGRLQPAAPAGSPEASGAVLNLAGEESGPEATLTFAGETQQGELGTYCWESDGVGACGDSAGYPRPQSFLRIPLGTIVEVTGDGEEVSAYLYDPPVEGEIGPTGSGGIEVIANGESAALEAMPGLYLLDVFSYFDRGDASFGFGVEIVEG